VARFAAVAKGQVGQQQIPVPLLAGGRGFGGPDGIQDCQMIGVGQGAVPVLGGGQELAISVQDSGQHGQRVAGRGGGGGDPGSFGIEAVIAVQLGCGAGPGMGSARLADTVNT
jgi:hypothetical protein